MSGTCSAYTTLLDSSSTRTACVSGGPCQAMQFDQRGLGPGEQGLGECLRPSDGRIAVRFQTALDFFPALGLDVLLLDQRVLDFLHLFQADF